MVPLRFMVVAGEPSGDMLAAELVRALQQAGPESMEFFGAGGPRMAEAGVELAFDLTRDAVVGLSDALRKYRLFRRRMDQLLALAAQRQPHAILCIDFSGFNLRLAHAVRQTERSRKIRIIQFVSPQVWASRPKRARKIERDIDLLLSIFPFEKDWYSQHAPNLKVEFVGHPILDRYADFEPAPVATEKPLVLLLPGSRVGELRRHIPVMVEAARLLGSPADVRMVLPDASLAELATSLFAPGQISLQVGGLPELLASAELAIAATGTVTLECAYFGVPTVAMYKTSWSTYQIGKRLITVNYLSMPNLLANEPVFPEFVQYQAKPRAIAEAANRLLRSPDQREAIREKLRRIVAQLGEPGAPQRAAEAVLRLLGHSA